MHLLGSVFSRVAPRFCVLSVVCRVPAYYALILRSLTVLEGLALQADPNYKLLGRAYPYIAKRLLTDPAPELRASFEDLILQVSTNAASLGRRSGTQVWELRLFLHWLHVAAGGNVFCTA